MTKINLGFSEGISKHRRPKRFKDDEGVRNTRHYLRAVQRRDMQRKKDHVPSLPTFSFKEIADD